MEFHTEDALSLLERTPAVLRRLLDGLPDRWLHGTEGAETFSPYEVVGHLIHGERTDWLPRLELILEAGESRPFAPFDRFAHRERGQDEPLSALLDRFQRLRTRNLSRLREMLGEGLDLSAAGRHPDFGRVTVRELLAAWVVHDLGHVRQVARVLAKQYSEEVGPWKDYLPVLSE